MPVVAISTALAVRAVGVQSWDNGDGDRLIVFAISTWQRWSSAAAHEFDVLIDVDQDGTPDYAVSSLDHGEVTAGSYDGTVASFLIDLRTKKAVLEGLAVAPTDESTLLLPVYASDLGLSSSSPRFAYSAQSFDGITGAEDSIARYARFNAWAGVFSQPVEVAVPAGRTAIVPLTVRTGELARTRPLGLMVVEQENANGAEQAQLIPLR